LEPEGGKKKMSESYSILKQGKAAGWRLSLLNRAMADRRHGVYQQEGLGLQTCIVHFCPNLGEPFDHKHHKAAQKMFDLIEEAPQPKGQERKAMIQKLAALY
jgi:hypothetical protein